MKLLQLLSLSFVLNADMCLGTVPTCGKDWFGSSCRYKCHCENNNCDYNRECTGSSTCKRGWFGPACQYVDLVATNTTSSTPAWVYDYPDSLCNTGQDVVTVTLQDTFYFTWLRLRVNTTGTSTALRLQLISSDGNSTNCTNMQTTVVSDTVIDIHCDTDAWYQQLIITGNGAKSLCAVYISGGRNVALGQDTSQTSIYSGMNSWKAVDGNRDSNYYHRSCTHIASYDQKASWILTFQRPHKVTRYNIYNRNSNAGRLEGFVLEAALKTGSMAFSYTDTNNNILDVYRIQSEAPQTPVSSVKISHYGRILTLCEVEMFGDVVCPAGKYGRECENDCHCAGAGETCFVSTGGCPSGCAAGYQGETCSHPCNTTYYGKNCAQRCSTNCKDQLCDPAHGNCQSCVTGKAGQSCDHVCGAAYYGENCAKNCSSNCMNQLCDSVNGICLTCVAGRTGQLCDQALQVQQHDNAPPAAAIVGPVVAFVVLVTLIFIGVLIWRRPGDKRDAATHGTFQDDVDIESTTNNAKPQEVALYNKCVDVQETPPVMTKPKLSRASKDGQESHVDGDYCNIFPCRSETANRFIDLEKCMAEHRKQFYQEQFYLIPENRTATTTAALSAENHNKNRYKRINAYDHSRVHLQTDPLKLYGDYINASYVDGYQQKRQFIASQGPTKIILKDFVRMLLEQEVQVVVMLTNLIEDGKLKCEQYWPDAGEINIGEITVKLTFTQVFADYTVRRLRLYKTSQPVQMLTHFHFTNWPDKDVPTTVWGLVDLEQRATSIATSKPIVVHCSAGVGRTGIFIALHNILEEIKHTGYFDAFTTVQKLRQDRMNMVQTFEQYEFLHKATQIAMVCRDTTVTSGNIRDRIQFLEENSESDQTNLEKEFKSVCLVCADDKGNEEEEEEDVQENNTYNNNRMLSNRMKDRLHNVLPKEYYRPVLSCEPGDAENYYINAVLIPSYKKHDHQILTQLPLSTTVIDFWRLVTQYKVSLIVAFERELGTEDMTSGHYLPEDEEDTKTCSFFNIKTTLLDSCDAWEVQRVTIVVNEENTTKSINFSFKGEYSLSHLCWKSKDLDTKTLLALMGKIRAMKPVGEGRTLYTCRWLRHIQCNRNRTYVSCLVSAVCDKPFK